MPDFSGPYYGWNLERGVLIAVCVTGIGYAVALWMRTYANAERREEARRRDEANLESERRARALRIVNDLKPLSTHPARRLSMHQERHPK